MSFVIPPFHHSEVIYLSISVLFEVELWVELGWNYVKFHPNSTHNSTTNNPLIIKAITTARWKGGTSNDKKYFSEKRQKKVLTAVKNKEKYSWYTHVYTHVYTHNSCISLSDFVSLHHHSIFINPTFANNKYSVNIYLP